MSSAPSLVCELGEVYAGIYRVKSLLGKGGSAEVYLVEHTTVHKPFALKVLNRSSRVDDRSLQRFRTEGRALFEVNHPNVVRVFHAGEDAVLGPMIAMEVLEGKTLAQVLAMARSLPPARAIPLVTQIAEAVEVLHQAGLIHRDLKPGNIFIEKATGPEAAVAARRLHLEVSPPSRQTAAGTVQRTSTDWCGE